MCLYSIYLFFLDNSALLSKKYYLSFRFSHVHNVARRSLSHLSLNLNGLWQLEKKNDIVWTQTPLSNLYICHTQGSHPYQSLSYTSGDTAADSPAHVSRAGLPAKDSPRKESLLSNLTGSFRSLHNLLEGTPQRNEPSAATATKSSSLTRTGAHARLLFCCTAANCSMGKVLVKVDH